MQDLIEHWVANTVVTLSKGTVVLPWNCTSEVLVLASCGGVAVTVPALHLRHLLSLLCKLISQGDHTEQLRAESKPQVVCVKALIHCCSFEELPHSVSNLTPFFLPPKTLLYGRRTQYFHVLLPFPRSSNFSVIRACDLTNACEVLLPFSLGGVCVCILKCS